MMRLAAIGFIAFVLFGLLLGGRVAAEEQPSFRFGLIADCQYADRDNSSVRHYRAAAQKLREAVADLNTHELAFVANLGDFIDKDWSSFDVLEPIAEELTHDWRHVLGNHDYSVADEFKPLVHERLGLSERYYTFEVADWTFVVTDGNDLSHYGWPAGSPQHAESLRIHEEYYPDHPTWNGGFSDTQMVWLTDVLDEADAKGRKVILFSHFPVFPDDPHNLWNAPDVVELIEAYPSVKAWVNGHNHAGAYAERNGVHYLTLKGMLDTTDTAYAIVEVRENTLDVQGVGRQESLSLKIR